jgi:hypothetical protein
MIDCEAAAKLISERLQHRLGLRRELALRFHVLICTACRRYAVQLRWLHQRLHGETRVESPAPLDAAVRKCIVERVQAAQRDEQSHDLTH